jgi:glycerol-3-phosphate dehydrogenase
MVPILRAGRVSERDLPKSKDSLRKMRLAIFLYDLVCGFNNYGKRQIIKDVQKLKTMEPSLESSRLEAAAFYFDTNVDDARLVIETLKEALLQGRAVALNYLRVVGFIHNNVGRISGVTVIDETTPTKEQIVVHGKVIVNTSGVWADDILSIGFEKQAPLIRTTKGVHLVYHRQDLPVNRAFGLRSIDDERFFFILPRNDWVIIGTTDTDYSGDIATPVCNREDADYLRNTVSALFPKATIGDERLQGTYAGLRPLVAEPGKAESEVSRKHVVLKREDGLFSLLGGKLTTFRKMAEDLFCKHIHKVQKSAELPKFSTKKNLSKRAYIVAITKEEWEKEPKVVQSKLSPRILHHLFEQYGRGGLGILQQVIDQPEVGQQIFDHPDYPVEVNPWILAEIDYVVNFEAPVRLVDVLCRRMEISWLIHPQYQGQIAAKVAMRMGKILGWSKTQIQQEIKQYLEYIRQNSFFYDKEIPIPKTL